MSWIWGCKRLQIPEVRIMEVMNNLAWTLTQPAPLGQPPYATLPYLTSAVYPEALCILSRIMGRPQAQLAVRRVALVRHVLLASSTKGCDQA